LRRWKTLFLKFFTFSLVGWESLGVEIESMMALAFWKSLGTMGYYEEESMTYCSIIVGCLYNDFVIIIQTTL